MVEDCREPPLEIVLEGESTSEDEQAVADLFAQFGISTDVLVRIRESVEIPQALAWFVVISAPLQVFLGVYCGAIAKRLGDDSYDAAKHLVTGLWQARKTRSGANGTIWLSDDEASVNVLLDEGLPREAYLALGLLDGQSLRRGDTLRWDSASGEWRPNEDPDA